MTRRERDELRLYLKGIPSSPPIWALCIEAADGDPLRAQEIYNQLDREWWEYWMTYSKEAGSVAKERERKLGNK